MQGERRAAAVLECAQGLWCSLRVFSKLDSLCHDGRLQDAWQP